MSAEQPAYAPLTRRRLDGGPQDDLTAHTEQHFVDMGTDCACECVACWNVQQECVCPECPGKVHDHTDRRI